MTKFVLMTRGRTGSTAVIDELGKTEDIFAAQELFIQPPYTKKFLTDSFTLFPPFDLWKQMPSIKGNFFSKWISEKQMAAQYLQEIEFMTSMSGARCFGMKILSHHMDQRPYLLELLKRRSYQVIYLRRNIALQVLSGMIANQRGIYYSFNDIEDSRRYQIEIEKFKWHIQFETACANQDLGRLVAAGFAPVEVQYEDFRVNREDFYAKIFRALNLEFELPSQSEFKKVIVDLKQIIKNYGSVADAAADLGLDLQLG